MKLTCYHVAILTLIICFSSTKRTSHTKTSNKAVKDAAKHEKSSLPFGFLWHQHGLLIIWTILADIMIIGVRYAKTKPNYFIIHAWIFTLIFILTFVLVKYVEPWNYEEPYNPKDPQMILFGNWDYYRIHLISCRLVVPAPVSTVTVQIILGILAQLNILPKKRIKWIHILEKTSLRRIHAILGIIIWVGARITVLTGSLIHAKTYSHFIFLYIIAESSLFFLIIFYLEFKKKKDIESHNKIRPWIPKMVHRNDIKLIDDINRGLPRSELTNKYPNRLILFFRDGIYDLGKFDHPGGNWIHFRLRFSEVSRYLYGVTGMDDINSTRRWHHSVKAIEHLEKKCYLGSLFSNERKTEWMLRNSFTGKVVYSSDEWSFFKKENLSEKIQKIVFKNDHFKLENSLKGSNWTGKHFSFSKDGKTRLYTNLISMAISNCEYRRSLLNIVAELDKKSSQINSETKKGLQDLIELIPEYQDTLSELSIVVKRYGDNSSLSSKIQSLELKDKLFVEGLIGRGFNFDDIKAKNSVILIAGGNGILPYLDLLDLLLKKMIYLYFQSQNLDTKLIKPEQDYEGLFDQQKFTLVAAFENKEEFIGLEIIQSLDHLNKKLGLDLFEVLIRIKREPEKGFESINLPFTNERFNKRLLEKLILHRRANKVYLCGTPGMNLFLSGELNEIEDREFVVELV